MCQISGTRPPRFLEPRTSVNTMHYRPNVSGWERHPEYFLRLTRIHNIYFEFGDESHEISIAIGTVQYESCIISACHGDISIYFQIIDFRIYGLKICALPECFIHFVPGLKVHYKMHTLL